MQHDSKYIPFTDSQKALRIRLDTFPEILDPGDRWEQGLPHRKDTEELFRDLSDFDWLYMSDYFGWKEGGDGDNGESFMYEMDCIFDLRDKETEVFYNPTTGGEG
jgi:hypothetical protein